MEAYISASIESTQETRDLLALLCGFCFPGGEDSARSVRSARTTQRGEMRSSPASQWIPFTAEEIIESQRSSFRWDARYRGGSKGLISVTDAYEEGHGRLVVKLGGIIPVQKVVGPEADKGELQRYLASTALCPPILLNHRSLAWQAVGPGTLRVRDREDSTGAVVDLQIGEDGRPLTFRAERPRIAGKKAILTPWSVACVEFRGWDGIRAASRIEVAWYLPEGPFTYYRSKIDSLEWVR